jgi:hypothetical protein
MKIQSNSLMEKLKRYLLDQEIKGNIISGGTNNLRYH